MHEAGSRLLWRKEWGAPSVVHVRELWPFLQIMIHTSSVHFTSHSEGAPSWNLTAGCHTVVYRAFHSQTHTHKHVGTQGTFELGFFHPSNFKVFLCSKSDTVPFGIYVYVPIRSALYWCSSLHLSYGLETHLHFVQNVLFTFGLEDQIIIVSRLYLHFYAPLQSSTLNPVNRWQRFSIFWITV